MPYVEDGTPIEILLNALGVPSEISNFRALNIPTVQMHTHRPAGPGCKRRTRVVNPDGDCFRASSWHVGSRLEARWKRAHDLTTRDWDGT